jgi:hypothetical protein
MATVSIIHSHAEKDLTHKQIVLSKVVEILERAKKNLDSEANDDVIYVESVPN